MKTWPWPPLPIRVFTKETGSGASCPVHAPRAQIKVKKKYLRINKYTKNYWLMEVFCRRFLGVKSPMAQVPPWMAQVPIAQVSAVAPNSLIHKQIE
jgi:hypothetical protein